MQKLLIILFTITLAVPAASSLSIMTYNVENLFDTLDDEGKDDKAYLPLAQKQSEEHVKACNKVKVKKWRNECLYFDWTEDAKNKKLANIKASQDEIKGKDDEDLDFYDERDKLIELKSTRVALVVFSLGFILALSTQAFGMSVAAFFLTMLGFGLLSEVIASIYIIIIYRKGA